MGGSQGASGINQAMIKAMPSLQGLPLQVIHLAGARDARLLEDNYRREKIPAYVAAFHHQMEEVYSAADLVIARSGAASLAELAAFALPAVLDPVIPMRRTITRRATPRFSSRQTRPLVMKESELSGDLLAKKIRDLFEQSGDALRTMSEKCRRARAEKRGRVGRRNDGKIQSAYMTPSPPDLDLQKFLTARAARDSFDRRGGQRDERHRRAPPRARPRCARLGQSAHPRDGTTGATGLRFLSPHRAEDARDAELIIYSSAIKAGQPDPARRASAEHTGDSPRRSAGCDHARQARDHHRRHARQDHYVGDGGTCLARRRVASVALCRRGNSDSRQQRPLGSVRRIFRRGGRRERRHPALFHPEHALVLNIEEEHLDYYRDLAAIEEVFHQVTRANERHSLLLRRRSACGANLRRARPRSVSYGFSDAAHYRATGIELQDFAATFCVRRGDEKLGDATLNVPGRHNVSNALGVIALATELGMPFAKIAKSLGTFRHARRRFEIKYQSDRFLLVDDYAHHPTEIRATLATARSAGRKRVLTMFQPHRYSRTKALRQRIRRRLRRCRSGRDH